MLDKVVRDAQDWNIVDAMMEDVLTTDDLTETLGELVNHFAGNSDFDEELFDFACKWAGKYMDECEPVK